MILLSTHLLSIPVVKRLFLSHVNIRFKWGQYIDSEESRFLSEIDEKFIIKKNFSESKNIEHNPYQFFSDSNQNTEKKLNYSKLDKSEIRNNSTKNSSYINDLMNGQIVKHFKFGTGKVINIEGTGGNRKATVFFKGIGQKQLLLKFAKLEVIK